MKVMSYARKASKLFLVGIVSMVTVVGLLVGCASDEPKSEPTEQKTEPVEQVEEVELSIFAANSLEKAMPEVQALYTEKNPSVTFSDTQFKGSGDLVAQLDGGATADVLITASGSTMNDAEEGDLIDSTTRTDMFGNDLVVVRSKGSDIQLEGLEEVTSPDITRIAIGDSALVPAGAYANQSLYSIGLYTSDSGKEGEYDAAIADKIALADKVGTAAQYVSTGDCQIGFVYSSDVYRYDGIETLFVTPADSHKPIIYPGAVCAKSTQVEEAQKFLDFCLSDPDAQKIWAQYGFELL